MSTMWWWIGFSLITAAQAYQLLHIRSPHGSQNFTWDEAQATCQKRGMELATWSQLQTAFKDGLDVCQCGWLKTKAAVRPIQTLRSGCGHQRGIQICTRASGAVSIVFGSSKAAHDAFCYSPEGKAPEMSTELCDKDPPMTLQCRNKKRMLLILEVKKYISTPCQGEVSFMMDYFSQVAEECSMKQECDFDLSHLRMQDKDVNQMCTCASVRFRCIEAKPVFDVCSDDRTELTTISGYLSGPKYPEPMPDILTIMQCNCTLASRGMMTFTQQDLALHRNPMTQHCQQNLAVMAPSKSSNANTGALTCNDNSYKEMTFVMKVTKGTSILYWNRPESDVDYSGTSGVSYGDYDKDSITGGRFLIQYKFTGSRNFKLICERTIDVAPPIMVLPTLKPITPSVLSTTVAVPPPIPPDQNNHTGAIIGGAVGGALFVIIILIIVVVVIIVRKRRSKSSPPNRATGSNASNGQILNNPSYNAATSEQIDGINGQNPLTQMDSGYTYVDETNLDEEKVEYYSSTDLANGREEGNIYVNAGVSVRDGDQGGYEAINPHDIEPPTANVYEGIDQPTKRRGLSKGSSLSDASGRSYFQYDDGIPQETIPEENIYDVCTPHGERDENVYDSLNDRD